MPGTTPLVRRGDRAAPLSSAQEGIWAAHTADESPGTWNVPVMIDRGHRLDGPALQAALNVLVARHEILRTRYAWQDGRPVQLIDDPAPVPVTVHGTRADMERAATRSFDLERTPPMRVGLWCGPGSDVLLLCLHHITVDGWSLPLLLHDLWISYDAALRGEPDARPPPELQYADFAAWEREAQATPDYEALVARRASQLRDLPPGLRLGRLDPPGGATGRGGQVRVTLSEQVSAATQEVARRLRVTPYVVLLSAFAETVRRWSGEPRFALATAAMNRPSAALESVVGCFATVAPIRCEVAPGDTFAQLCAAMRGEFAELLRHQAVPVEHLAGRLPGVALAQVGFVVLNTSMPQPGGAVPISEAVLPTGTATSDLTLVVEPGDTISVTAEFDTTRYARGVVERVVDTLRAVLTAAVAKPDTVVAALPVAEAAQRPGVLVGPAGDLLSDHLHRMGGRAA
jgi:hypothetical protein